MIEQVSRIVKKPKNAFLAAGIRSHGKGVFLKKEFDPKDIELEELFEIKKDDFIVNITFAWEGACAFVPENANGALVSHRFPTFRVQEPNAAISFLKHFILTKEFVFNCGFASPGGAGRNRVLNKKVFLKTILNAPNVLEQKKIGDLLDTIALEIKKLREQRNFVDLQKKGLMQKLLTGKIRVKV